MNQDHLDAEAVAAWLDGSLDRAARAEAEAHAADCARCQAVLAAMVRIEPEPAHRKAAWFTAPVRWALPLATAAAALGIWVAVNRDPGVPDAPHVAPARQEASKATEQTMADRALESAPLAQPGPAAAPGGLQNQRASNTPAAPRTGTTRRDQTRKEAAEGSAAPAAVAESVAVEQLTRDRVTPQRELPKTAASPAPPPPGPPVPSPAASPTVDAATERVERRLARVGAMAVGVREFASPDMAARWRLGGDGTIHRSTDAGKTWAAQTSGVTTALLSASAPAANICWIVGRSGVVLLSTDGATWRRLAFPELVDLRSVTATDARTASVTTADGRVFRTTDGGVTWAP